MITAAEIERVLESAKLKVEANLNREVYAKIFSSLDLTTLSPCDTERSVREFARRVTDIYTDFPDIENVASICVFPPFVECVGLEIDSTPMRITSVAAGFPASQTFLEVKALEVAMAIESGADEVDVVIPVGKILEGEYDDAKSEIELLRNEADEAVLKVILEVGELKEPQKIYDAAMVAMSANADFIKTSTGKTSISATPEAVVAMCLAARDYYAESHRMVGIKVAGGVRSTYDATLYYTIVQEVLGEEWLNNRLFRIGASAVANQILSSIYDREIKHF